MSERILLCGFMGSGKSTLLEKIGQGQDLDRIIEKSIGGGLALGEWIEKVGWDVFRRAECAALAQWFYSEEQVLALGGGSLESAESRKLIAENGGTLIWLETPFDICYERIAKDKTRPLFKLGREELDKLYQARLGNYRSSPISLLPAEIEVIDSPSSFWELIRLKLSKGA